MLQTLARPLLEGHAAEALKDELVRLINASGSLSYGPTRPTPPPGAHVCGQALWLASLEQEAIRLRQTCDAVSALPDLQPTAIAARYNSHLAQFQNPAFLSSGDYLVDMGGKEMLSALSRHLHSLRAPGRLDQSALATGLLGTLERIYQPNSIYQPDDFSELAGVLRQY